MRKNRWHYTSFRCKIKKSTTTTTTTTAKSTTNNVCHAFRMDHIKYLYDYFLSKLSKITLDCKPNHDGQV
jgi:hypothetical protein